MLVNYNQKNNKEGFTLIELLVVIVIIGILATLAVPAFSNHIEKSKEAVDAADLRILNSATNYFALDEGKSLNDLFPEELSDTEKIQLLYTQDFLKTTIEPTQKEAHFVWDESDTIWEIFLGDLQYYELKDALETSSIQLSEFIVKNQDYAGYNNSVYSTDNWNGYLEKLLEKGDIGDDTRLKDGDEGYGKNTIGYVNPVNNNESVVNYTNLDWAGVGEYIPPAIFITNQDDFSYQNISNYAHPEKIRGTMIFYKSNETENEDMEIFYVREDGTLSELKSINEILP